MMRWIRYLCAFLAVALTILWPVSYFYFIIAAAPFPPIQGNFHVALTPGRIHLEVLSDMPGMQNRWRFSAQRYLENVDNESATQPEKKFTAENFERPNKFEWTWNEPIETFFKGAHITRLGVPPWCLGLVLAIWPAIAFIGWVDDKYINKKNDENDPLKLSKEEIDSDDKQVKNDEQAKPE